MHQKLPNNWKLREILRDKGQFWTPNWVAEAMVSYVSKETELIFDPAAGRGAFLEALIKLNKKKISFYGIDIDEDVLSDKIYNNEFSIIEKRDFIRNPPQKKFKAIVANPPYIRHHRISEETKRFLKKLFATITGFNIDGRAGYHIYFFVKALNILETGGKLAFIMPSDTCEGVFAEKLWKWISKKFCIEAVITFDEKATPFPNVDTNAIVFLIKKSDPIQNILWVKSNQANSSDLLEFVSSGFKKNSFNSLKIVNRNLEEAIATGLTRPEQKSPNFKFHLYDFAKTMRGIATGSNEFFFLTEKQVNEYGLPKEFIKRAIGRTKDIKGNILLFEDIDKLDVKGRPTYLLSIKNTDILPETVIKYLKMGERMNLPNKSLIKQRKPWYKMENREIPPILFAYLGRRNSRFILNEAGILPLTGFLCIYPIYNDKEYIRNLWQALNHPETLKNLNLVGKSYGSGSIKVEPGKLSKLPISENIVNLFSLKRQYVTATGQLDFFRDSKIKHHNKKGLY